MRSANKSLQYISKTERLYVVLWQVCSFWHGFVLRATSIFLAECMMMLCWRHFTAAILIFFMILIGLGGWHAHTYTLTHTRTRAHNCLLFPVVCPPSWSRREERVGIICAGVPRPRQRTGPRWFIALYHATRTSCWVFCVAQTIINRHFVHLSHFGASCDTHCWSISGTLYEFSYLQRHDSLLQRYAITKRSTVQQ